MRIAHVSDCFLPRLGGIEMQVNDLTRQQQERGLHPAVLTASPAPRRWRAEPGGAPVHRFGFRVPLEFVNNPLPSRPLTHALRAGGYDVVHVHGGVGSPFAAAGVRVALTLGLPLVVTVHCLRPAVPLPAALAPWTSRSVAGRIVLTAVSEAAAAPLRERTGAPVRVLPNGLDADAWRVTPDDGEPGTVRVVATMRLAGRKRPMALLQMFAEARRRLGRDADLRLTVYGDGIALRRMRAFVARHRLEGAVTLAGRVPRLDLPDRYRRADLFVAPAYLESFGIAALEARCAGLPVLAMRGSGIAEFVEHGREGLLAGSDDDMVDALVLIARDASLRRHIAEHNRITEPPAAWPKVLDRFDDAYAQAIAGG